MTLAGDNLGHVYHECILKIVVEKCNIYFYHPAPQPAKQSAVQTSCPACAHIKFPFRFSSEHRWLFPLNLNCMPYHKIQVFSFSGFAQKQCLLVYLILIFHYRRFLKFCMGF